MTVTLDGRFELLERLDDFGDGEAWKARELQVRTRAVAVKLLSAERIDAARVKAAQSLRHGAVLSLLHHGRSEDRVYLAYDHFEAPSLASWLARVWRGDELASRATLERIAERVCEAVEAAHAQTQPLAHGSLSPRSALVRVSPQGVDLRVFDFGLADASKGLAGDIADVGRVLRELFVAPACRRDGAAPSALDRRRDELPDELWSVALRAMDERAGEGFADMTAVLEALDAARRCQPKGPAPSEAAVASSEAVIAAPPDVAVAPSDVAVAPSDVAVAPSDVAVAPSDVAVAPPEAVTAPRRAPDAPSPVAGAAPRVSPRAKLIAAAAVTGVLLAVVFTLALRAALL
ncbi:MAG: hypothetical protein U0326_23335 [Polyangiales bacterium]